MLKEINYDIATWWNEQSFEGKDLFKITELGALSLNSNHFLKERNIAYLSLDNADIVLKNLQEKYLGLEVKLKEIEVEWIATEDKLKLADKIEHFKDWMQSIIAIGDFSVSVKLVLEWENTIQLINKENYNAKIKLVELAESIVDSDNWKEATQTLRDISEKWKHTGTIDKFKNDKLFSRLESAKKRFQDRKRDFLQEEEKDMNNNLDLKMEIVEQAELLANSQDWKNTSETFHKLMESWKTIGKTPNKKNEELWLRLLASKNTFFDNKKSHFNEVQQEQDSNYLMKLKLIDRAEALKDSTDWTNTTQAYATIMDEWKKIGKVPFEKSDEIWKRLNEACDNFFNAKKQHAESIKLIHETNYNLKIALLARAEELKNSYQWNEATVEFMQLMDEWKKIGAVPKEFSNTIWDAFSAARKHFFARKDADREERKQQFEARNLARAEQDKARNKARIEEAKSKIVQITTDIKEEEEKLIDFTAAIQNITPGKKAAELKAHLEKLIEETKVRLKQLKDKQALAGTVTEMS